MPVSDAAAPDAPPKTTSIFDVQQPVTSLTAIRLSANEDARLSFGYAQLAQQANLAKQQMDLQALGYVLKGSKSEVCSQCHQEKSYKGNTYVFHTRHVIDRNKDCSYCHDFSRPERGLEIDPTP